MKSRRTSVLVVVGAALLVLAGTTISWAASEKAPDFTLKNLSGEDVKLTELLKDGPVVIDFWATWCKPCIKGFPQLQELFDNYRNCGMRVLAVSIDGPRSASRVGSFIQSKEYTFEVLLDSAQKVAKKYHVSSVPRTVLVGTDGAILYSVTGYRPGHHEELAKTLKELFPEECPEEPVTPDESEAAETPEAAEGSGE
jgi:cytochrome c biogenesis protein CcmG/thiol:disulfide interchange protein DsbE